MTDTTAAAFTEPSDHLLVSEPLELPAERTVVYALTDLRHATASTRVVLPRDAGASPNTVFIVDRDTVVPPIALALQRARHRAILAHGDYRTGLNRTTVALPGGWTVQLPLSDFVIGGRRHELKADATVAGTFQ